MDNLHRELAPVSDEAWAQIAEEAARTFKRNLAGRRLVDVQEPGGEKLAAVNTGRLAVIEPPGDGITAQRREAVPLVRLRVPFTLDRAEVDDVARGAQDSDWQPVKDAARLLAFAEDRAVFDGYPAAGIRGIRPASSNPVRDLPQDARGYPEAIAQALSALRTAGVNGPYAVALSAAAYTAVTETSHNGYPVIEHIRRMFSGEIVWAPAIAGAVVLSARGGDFDLRLGQDVSIGYLSHTDTEVRLYLQESLTFLTYTDEAAVTLSGA